MKSDLASKLSKYTTLNDHNLLKEVIKQEYATKEYQEHMEQRVRPLLDECDEKLKAFCKDNDDVKSAIIQFDKVLTTKADRFNIIETKDWTIKEFYSLK